MIYEPIVGFLLGVILGSLAKALADRSLSKTSFWGRSYCPKCKHKLQLLDLLPIFSYFFLRGRCRYCHKKIPIEYLLVEVAMGLLVAYLFHLSVGIGSPPADLLFNTFFITVLAILFLTDLKKMLIPDRIILPSLVIALVSLVALTLYKIWYLYYFLNLTPFGRLLLPGKSDYFVRHAFMATEPLLWAVLLGLAIGGFFFMLIMVTKGRGMGGGDVKLGAFMGLGLGFPNGLLAVILAFLTGAIFALILIILGKKRFGENIPFGPFLVVGSLVSLFWGNQIMDWYLNLAS